MGKQYGQGKLKSFCDRVQDWLLIALMSGVAVLVFIQVLLRYLFHAPLMGIEELLLVPTTWLFLIGAVRASSEKSHIIARVVEIFLSKNRAISLLRALASFLSFVVLLWLSWWGWDYFKYLLRMQKETPTLFIPSMWYESLLFISFVLMAIYTLLELFEHLYYAYHNMPETIQLEGDIND